MKWADGTAYDDTAFQNWPAHKTPVNKEDESQCGSIYAGTNNYIHIFLNKCDDTNLIISTASRSVNNISVRIASETG